MKDVTVTVGSESSEEEYQTVKDIFNGYPESIAVENNYARNAYGELPMVVMILAQNVAGNVIWDLIKFSYKKILTDGKLQNRKPTIVVKRKYFDAVITKDGFHARSVEENMSFDNINDLIEYDKNKKPNTL